MAKKRTKRKTTKRKPSFASKTKKFKGKKLGQLRNQKNKPRVDPLWTLEDGITYSMLSKFQGCRHRFHISKVQGWKPKRINFPLEFGNIFHHMTEAQDMGIALEHMPMIANNYVNAKIKEKDLDADAIKELSILGAVASITFEQYVAFWEQNHSFSQQVRGVDKHFYEKDFNWIGKEDDFDINYTLPNGRKVRMRGKMDGRFNLKRNIPGNWLFETKTKGKIDTGEITGGLHKDLQTGMYMTAMQHLQKGTPPAGVLYNVIRRTQLKPRVKEPAKDFATRVEQDIMKRPEWYFMRWTRRITSDELLEFQRRQLNPALFQLVTWWDSIKGNPMRPFETTCDKCKVSVSFGETKLGEGKLISPTCSFCNGTGVVDNLEHYERAFGVYDSMAHGRGDYFDIVTNDNFYNYEQAEYAFPELEAEDDIDPYLVGVPRQ